MKHVYSSHLHHPSNPQHYTDSCWGSSGVPFWPADGEAWSIFTFFIWDMASWIQNGEGWRGRHALQGVLRLYDLLFNALVLFEIFTQLSFLFKMVQQLESDILWSLQMSLQSNENISNFSFSWKISWNNKTLTLYCSCTMATS